MTECVSQSVIIKTRYNEIWLEDDILMVRAHTEGEMDIEEAQACFEAYHKLGCHLSKPVQLMDLSISVIISKEARDYVDKVGPDYFIASAVVSRSLSVRIIINFCMRFFNPVVPLRMFNSAEDALKWLEKYRSKSSE